MSRIREVRDHPVKFWLSWNPGHLADVLGWSSRLYRPSISNTEVGCRIGRIHRFRMSTRIRRARAITLEALG